MKRKMLFSVIVVLLLLFILESAARLLESTVSEPPGTGHKARGWQSEFFKSFLDWHESDPNLLWRFKANLNNPLIKTNSEHLLGSEIPPKKDTAAFRILLLGDSSPVGLGLKSRRQAFGEVLKYLLELEYLGNKEIELVNSAVSGYTSEQVVRFLKHKGWSYKPDLVVLYCGNNDASISGTMHDHQLLEGQKLRAVRRLLGRLAIYRALRNLLANSAEVNDPSEDKLKLRVPPDRFAENLSGIVVQCRMHDCPLIILKPPVPYLWPAGLQFKFFTHITGEDGRIIFPDALAKALGRNIKYCLNQERFGAIYGEGDLFTRSVFQSAYSDSMNPEEAIVHYSKLAETQPDDPVILNNLGVSYWQNEQYDKADRYLKAARASYIQLHYDSLNECTIAAGSAFLYNIGVNLLIQNITPNLFADTSSPAYIYLDSALQTDYFSLRTKRTYWEKIDGIENHENVVVIDLPRIFRENGGEKLFIDHCHPTAGGHRLIAQELLKIIRANAMIR